MTVGTKAKRQFRGLFAEAIPFKATVDVASIADGNEAANEVTVTGAALGDFVLIAPGIDVTDLHMVPAVTAANTVTIVTANNTGGTIDLASQTVTGVVLKPNDNLFGSL